MTDRGPKGNSPAPFSGVVSVLMPFLNAAPYLDEAIQSVRAQSYPHWELLLADDGATDGSSEIAERHATEDPARIRRLAHPGGATLGASAARNLALRAATGAYVAFLDGDDVWRPHKLAEQVALLAAHPEADALFGATEYWHSWTGRAEDAGQDVVLDPGFPAGALVRPPEVLARMLTGEVAVPCTCSLIVRRAAAERAGGFEEQFRRVFTDQAFYAKLFLTATTLVSDACWDRYRQHPASSCASTEREGVMRAEWRRYLGWLAEYLRARGQYAGALATAVRVARLRTRHPKLGRAFARGRALLRRASA